MAKINGRTLRLSPNYRAKLKRLHEKRWLDICPKCERQNLFDDQQEFRGSPGSDYPYAIRITDKVLWIMGSPATLTDSNRHVL